MQPASMQAERHLQGWASKSKYRGLIHGTHTTHKALLLSTSSSSCFFGGENAGGGGGVYHISAATHRPRICVIAWRNP